ncbi:UNVERIFIED_CONTAM: hypothetical protein GTU68_058494 [Idotea baltica]|nr:hypothetical protein [Idotea baltica]
MHTVVKQVTQDLRQRSQSSRQQYLGRCARTRDDQPPKKRLSCGNIAHGYAACSDEDKLSIGGMKSANVGIITAYNDMLSAHQPLATYPDMIKKMARDLGGTAQVASGVPAMCDGVTQGQPGMELSLFSRDVVAMSTAVGLSHNLFDDVITLLGAGLDANSHKPSSDNASGVEWTQPIAESAQPEVLAPLQQPFSAEGGLRCLTGNLGQGVIKVSAVDIDRRTIKAPCRIFHTQDALKQAFDLGELDRDVIAVVRFQGPAANGMPELHKMTPYLGVLQDKGFRVALITDGRMSGASGKVPAAIHVTPEAINGGPIGLLRDGDMVELNSEDGSLIAHVPSTEWQSRTLANAPAAEDTLGRNLFEMFRGSASGAMLGASVFERTPG